MIGEMSSYLYLPWSTASLAVADPVHNKPLHRIAYKRGPGELFVQPGKKMKYPDEYGRSALHYAALDGDAENALSLIRSGTDINLADKNGWTPLHFAAQAQSVAVARVLVENGAMVDPHDSHGNTPLFRAVFESRGRGEMIQFLLGKGADPNLKNKAGQTPVGLARLIGNFNVKRFFEDMK